MCRIIAKFGFVSKTERITPYLHNSPQKDPHGGHSIYRPRSHKRTIGLKTYNQPHNSHCIVRKLYRDASNVSVCCHMPFPEHVPNHREIWDMFLRQIGLLHILIIVAVLYVSSSETHQMFEYVAIYSLLNMYQTQRNLYMVVFY